MLLYGCERCDRGTEQEKECSYRDVRDVTEALSRRKSAPIWM